MSKCAHESQYGREEPHGSQPPSAGNFCTKTGWVWCEDCHELLWKYEVYLDGTRFEWDYTKEDPLL